MKFILVFWALQVERVLGILLFVHIRNLLYMAYTGLKAALRTA